MKNHLGVLLLALLFTFPASATTWFFEVDAEPGLNSRNNCQFVSAATSENEEEPNNSEEDEDEEPDCD